MKHLILVLILSLAGSFIIKAQDSTATLKYYEKKIEEGQSIKNIGTILIIAGAGTTVYAAALKAPTVASLAFVITLFAIPIAVSGKSIENKNRELRTLYKLGISLNEGNVPTLNFAVKF